MSKQCSVCIKPVSPRETLQCNNCKRFVHKKCNKLNDIHYKILQSNSIWFCIVCNYEIFPFSKISDNELKLIFFNDNISQIDELPNNLKLFPSDENSKLFTKFNDFFTSSSFK